MRLDHLGKVGVFTQKTVTRVDRVGARDDSGGQDGRDVQVALTGRGRADANAFIGKAHVHRVNVGGRVHGDCRYSQLAAGALDAERDFAPVGDQDLLKHQAGSMINSGWSYSTGWPDTTSIRVSVPARGALIWLKVFIASISKTVWPAVTA